MRVAIKKMAEIPKIIAQLIILLLILLYTLRCVKVKGYLNNYITEKMSFKDISKTSNLLDFIVSSS